ncbi:MAG: flagellar biosynthesis protein [Ruminiclostridium sp.]|nr:flagellar biosynthesis protein [Ruminiclostridium sp.]
MYNKIFKNNQVTYGAPFKVRIPTALQNTRQQEEGRGIFITPDGDAKLAEKPEEIIQHANEEAAMIIKEAEYEARRIMDDAFTEGREKAGVMEEEAWQKGYAEGIAAAAKQCEATIEEAEEIKADALMKHDEVLAGIEAEIINLVIDVSKKVIGSEIALNKENMIFLIKQAIDNCSSKNGIILKVSPEDYNYLDTNRGKLAALIDCADEIELKQEMSLKQGACILETPFGNMDAGVQTKLGKIEEAFRELAACK